MPISDVPPEVDTVIVGAGFAGMYMLIRVRELGHSAVVFETAPDVGGTWYWNAYPGARCDVDSLLYNYSFDPELRAEYQTKWTHRYARQPQILEYARHVADRYDLRRDICFSTRVTNATWEDGSTEWVVRTDQGHEVRARFLISAVGCLSTAQMPSFPGLETFQGQWYHTSRWPHQPVDLAGKRVIQIGTGSTGIQSAPVIAAEARHLTVLQRTPQYSSPAGDEPLTPEAIERSMKRFADMAKRLVPTGPDLPPIWEVMSTKTTFEDSPEEQDARFEALWARGGPGVSGAYKDVMTDRAANGVAAEFVRRKIRGIVKDPETAAKLMPTYLIGTKRPVCDTNYYETFNRSNVSLEDIRSDPIDHVVPEGIVLRSGKLIEADVIVFATGFDAMTGTILALNLVGIGGERLEDVWHAGPRTYLGIAVSGFPNLFLITGPGSPSVLSNVIFSIEQHVNWLTKLLARAQEEGVDRIEAEADSQDRWVDRCAELASRTLYPQTESWYTGANIDGKPRVFMPYVAGNAWYQRDIDEVADKGYEGFRLTKAVPPSLDLESSSS